MNGRSHLGLVELQCEVQPITNAGLVGNLTHQLDVSLAVAGQSQMQLSLQRRELGRAAQACMKQAKLGEEGNQLLGDKGGVGSTTKPADGNANLNRQPIVIVILADGRTLVVQNLYLDAFMF